MNRHTEVARAVRKALWLSAIAAASTTGVQAQDQESLEVVTVTGSRISNPNLESISPVSSITAEDILASGQTNIEDVINQLPQLLSAQGSSFSNDADGTANLDLRGLGANRTLVLVNGKRLAPGDANSDTFAPDVNQIPSALIKRVEILTGGASSVYGADAVAGVVNFIMDTKFEGIRFDAGYSFNQHKNDNQVAAIVEADGFPAPSGTVRTGYTNDFSFILGSNFADDRGNATFYATYREADPVLQGDYDYSSCTFNSGDVFTCGGSGTSDPARVRSRDPITQDRLSYYLDPNSGVLLEGQPGPYNFGPLNFYQRPDERYTAGTFLNYEFNDKVEAYGEFMFMKDRSLSQIAPSGIFGDEFTVSCSNPLWTAAQEQAFCGQYGLDTSNTSTDVVELTVGKRNVEGGGRQQDLGHTSYRTVIGFRGDLSSAWKYDASFQHSETQMSNVYNNDFSISRTARALNVVADANGNAVCQSVVDQTDLNCVPYNIWALGAIDAAQLAYLQIPLLQRGQVDERIANASFTGDLGEYGLKMPGAELGVQIAIGAEWRDQQSEFTPDASYIANDGAGQGAATLPLTGGYDVKELFAEVRVPILEDKPFARSLSVEAGYRYSDYSLDFSTDTYKAGLEWSPIDAVKLRGSFQRAVRVPNITELFATQQVALNGTLDPCAGDAPLLTAAQCANTGLDPADYGTIEANPAAQYNGFIGGNPDLQPETADTVSFGFAFQPEFLQGFRLIVDYYDIKIDNAIQQPNSDFTVLNCAVTGDPLACSRVVRDPDGSLFESDFGYVFDLTQNIGSIRTKGIDFDVSYAMDIGNFGRLRTSFLGSLTDTFEISPQPGVNYDCVGLFGGICTGGSPTNAPMPEWKHRASLGWGTPWAGLDVMLTWRYMGEVKRDLADDQASLALLGSAVGLFPTDAKMGSRSYLDLTAAVTLMEHYTFRVGVNNVTDKDPPLVGSSTCPTGPCNGNTYPQAYDSLGRQFFLNVTAKF